MAQVIDVHFLNPATGEELHQDFTKAESHREAIALAYHQFSAGHDETLKESYQDPDYEQGTFTGTGANTAWKYIYRCVIEDPQGGPDLSMLAVLFTQYKEKSHALPS